MDKETVFAIIQQIESFASRSIRNKQLREEYTEGVKEMSQALVAELNASPERGHEIAKEAIQLRNDWMERTRANLGPEELKFSKALKEEGLNIEKLLKKELERNFGSRGFDDLSEEEQLQFYHNVVQSSGRTSKNVNLLVKWLGRAGRVVLIISLLTVHLNNPLDSDPYRTLMQDKVGASISWAMRYNAKRIAPAEPKTRKAIFEKKGKNRFLGKKLVQITLTGGVIECSRLDMSKVYFKTNLALGISLDRLKDRQKKEWIVIIVNDKKYHVKINEEKVQLDWFKELEDHQRYAILMNSKEK